MTTESELTELRTRLDRLEHDLGIQQDIHAVRRLQYAYGYFIDKTQYDEVVDLFADDGEVWFLGGKYRGKAGVRRLYVDRFRKNFTNDHNGPIYGWLLDHPQLQMIVDVAPDRNTAKVRGRSMMQAGLHANVGGNTRQWWEGGIYENEYVRTDGVWRIKRLDYRAHWHGSFEHGWAYTKPEFIPMSKICYPQDPLGPDELMDPQPMLWPATDIVPFHYAHPVTGKPIDIDNSRARAGVGKATV